MQMKKTILLFSIIALLLLTGCEHMHSWKKADCITPKTCKECGETTGEALGHEWSNATCIEPETCVNCDAQRDAALGHDWQGATCTSPKTCNRCNITEGDTLQHSWIDATCTAPQTCSLCAATTGNTLEHSVEEWIIKQEATCVLQGIKTGSCVNCGLSFEENTETIDHIPGEWEITKEASSTSNGTRSKLCTECDSVLETESFSLSAEEIEAEYKKSCKSYTYNEIARNPGDYKGKYAVFTGKVIQVQQQATSGIMYYVLRVNVTKGTYSYSDTVYVTYYALETDARILEDDIIVMYGKLNGEKTYTTVMGASVTIPYFQAQYIDIK